MGKDAKSLASVAPVSATKRSARTASKWILLRNALLFIMFSRRRENGAIFGTRRSPPVFLGQLYPRAGLGIPTPVTEFDPMETTLWSSSASVCVWIVCVRVCVCVCVRVWVCVCGWVGVWGGWSTVYVSRKHNIKGETTCIYRCVSVYIIHDNQSYNGQRLWYPMSDLCNTYVLAVIKFYILPSRTFYGYYFMNRELFRRKKW